MTDGICNAMIRLTGGERMYLILTVLTAAGGSYLFYKIKVPAGALIGSIVFSSVFNILTGAGTFPGASKMFVQAIAGAFIGARVTRRDIAELRATLCGGILMLFCMLLYNLFVGYFLAFVTSLDLPTALVSAMPAGLSDTAVIASDLGADTTQSTLLATFRTLFSLIVLPQAAHAVCESVKRRERLTKGGRPDTHTDNSSVPAVNLPPQESRTLKNFVITFLFAQTAGLLGKRLGVPAGAMTFAILAVAFLNVKYGRAFLPNCLKYIAQCVTGILVGSRITMSDVCNLRYLVLPVLLLLLSAAVCNYVCAFLLHRMAKLDLFTSLFGSIPAGVSDMALIATDMGGNAPKVSVLQLVRYIGIFTIMPTLIKLIT